MPDPDHSGADSGAGRSAPPDLVIFDCDGVLVDSEPISLAVLIEVLREADCHLDPQDAYDHLLGRSLGTVIEWTRTEHGVTLTDAHLHDIRGRLFARFRTELAAIPGIPQAVRALPCRTCVASSSQLDRIRLSLSVTGLLDLFEPHVYSAAMVARGKPAPDLFLYAARQMGARPERCVVVEDSPAGVTAARAAGMRVIAFLGGSHAGPARLRDTVANLRPDAMIDDMTELPALLRDAV